MATLTRSGLQRALDAATDRRLIQWQPLVAVFAITTLIHAWSSPDLGLTGLHIRIPLAVGALMPWLILVLLAHGLADHLHRFRPALVSASYLLGGALRGLLLETGLAAFDLTSPDVARFRVISGIVIVVITAASVSYAWSTLQQARTTVADLIAETDALQSALTRLRDDSQSTSMNQFSQMSQAITAGLADVAQLGHGRRHEELQRLVDDVVRPLSRRFADDITTWRPIAPEPARVTMRSVWLTLDPLRHLPAPTVALAVAAISGLASVLALFTWQQAVAMTVIVVATLWMSLTVFYWLGRRTLAHVKPPLRDALITIGFVLIAVPPAWGTTLALAGSPQSNSYVVAALIVVPLFGWIMLVGNAAWDQVASVTERLQTTRDDLRWTLARINTLSWYHRGVVSRLLHGPIQNTIQVAILRSRSADDEAASDAQIDASIARINSAIAESMDHDLIANRELSTMQDVVTSWQGIAEITISLSDAVQQSLTHDPAAAAILVDLVQEVSSNAIRHGSAQTIRVDVTLGATVAHVRVLDDGNPFPDSPGEPGLGEQFLRSCSLEWNRQRQDGMNILTLAIPVTVVSAEAPSL